MTYDQRITIRTSTDTDLAGLARLAALDSADVPHGRTLIAEVDGTMRAALPLDGDRAIADPFAESAHVIELLEAYARALPRSTDGGGTRRARMRARLAHATAG